MTVQVAFEVRNGPALAPAAALFLPTRDASALLAICTRLGLDPWGRVHDVTGGFLLELEQPLTEPVPGATPLRALAPDFYLPVDAALVPALLDDEAAGLVRDGGLIFLPGGRILRLHRRAPMDLGRLLIARPRPIRAWAPLPEPRRLAERVVSIDWEPPEVPPESLYRELGQDLRRTGARHGAGGGGARTERLQGPGEAGAEDASTEEPEGEGQGGRDGAALAGDLLPGVQGLADSLRGLISQAGAGFSALREKLQWEWVDHSSLVQKLLHEFREGDPSRALRHAFSMVPADPRQPWVGWGNRLPLSRAIYNLMELIGKAGRGQSVGIWRARPHLIEELGREYRKAAERAIREGDFRRAAYIYGKLLGEDRMAAHALQRGGLHRDAAILYLKKLDDPAAAAKAFEAAGAADRAIELYRRLGQHIAAGDLLRRIGEEDSAVAEYVLAAGCAAAAVHPDYYASGTILNVQARRPDLAVEHFRKGWDRRPASNATLCALELAIIHGGRGEIASIRSLLDEADAFFRSVGSNRDADTFYNTTTLMARATPAMAPYAEEVRDRALQTLAWRLRKDVESGRAIPPTISTLFGASAIWPPALRRDADFAAAGAREQSRFRDRDSSSTSDPGFHLIRLGMGTVTAASQSPNSRDVFVGFDDGKVLSLRPRSNQVVLVARSPGVVSALAVDPFGQAVVALRQTEHSAVLSCSIRLPDGTFRTGPEGHFPGLLGSWLTPILPWGTDWLVGLGYGRDLMIVEGGSWMCRARLSIVPAGSEPPGTALLIPADPSIGPADGPLVLTHDGSSWVLLDSGGRELHRAGSAWSPAAPGARSLRGAPVTWMPSYPFVELISLVRDGAVYVSEFHVLDGRFHVSSSRAARTDQIYLAATRCGSGSNTVVAVSRARIDWLSVKTNNFQPARSLPCPSLAPAVGCFFTNAPEEVVVVFADGTITRIDAPRRRRSASGYA
jgi:tetratricopeptide (TPR) repeat protein